MNFLSLLFGKTPEIPYMADLANASIGLADGVETLKLEAARRGTGSGSIGYRPESWWLVAQETECILIHVVHRLSLGVIDEPRRSEFLHVFEQHGPGTLVGRAFKGASPDECTKRLDAAKTRLSAAHSEYFRYQDLAPIGSQSPKGTLLWEASKNLARLAGEEGDIAFIMYCQATIVTLIDALQINSVVEKSAKHES